MGRRMSLRGSWDAEFGQPSTEGKVGGRLIFEYESPDRSRGWKIKDAYVWIQEATGLGGGDARALWQVALLTDQIDNNQSKITDIATANRYQSCLGAGDNRSVAWMTCDMLIRDAVDADWIVPHGATSPTQCRMIVDEDRIVTNELYILSYGLSEAQNYSYVANYYVVLEEVKLTSTESVFNQIKGIGQDSDHPVNGFPTS